MKKQTDSDFLPEYDFSAGVRGKYVTRLAKGTNTDIDAATTLYYLSNHGFHLIEDRFGREAKLPD